MDNDDLNFIKGMEAERAAAVACIKGMLQGLYDADSDPHVFDALCHVIATLKCGHHWLK